MKHRNRAAAGFRRRGKSAKACAMGIAIDFFGEWRNRLGESPLWDARTDCLYWVDSVARLVCRADAAGGAFRSWNMPSMVGSVVLGAKGLLVALADGFHALGVDGALTPLALPEQGNPAVRFNDGKADRAGHFVAGTMRVGAAADAPGKLYRLEADGTARVLERDIMLANATCFSPDGTTLYFADSLQHLIWAYDYDSGAGTVANRRVVLDTTPLGSVPDGATVDARGHLWVALVQAQQLVEVMPDGTIVRRLDLPIPFPSCPAFGGDDLTTLFVTSLSDTGGAIRTDHPDGGRILAITGHGATGLAEAVCPVPAR